MVDLFHILAIAASDAQTGVFGGGAHGLLATIWSPLTFTGSLTLANMADLISFAIPVAIFVIGGIGNAIYKQKEQEKARKRSRDANASTGQARADLQDLASKRQAELRKAAQRRRERYESPARRRGGSGTRGAQRGGAVTRAEAQGGTGGAGGAGAAGGQSQPENLTMAQRIERARAKAQYAERAEDLRTAEQRELAPSERSDEAQHEAREAERDMDQRTRDEAQEQRRQEADHARREREEQKALERQRQQQTTRPRQAGPSRHQQSGSPQRSSSSSQKRSGQRSSSGAGASSARPYSRDQAVPYSYDEQTPYRPEAGDRWQGGQSIVHETQIGTGDARPNRDAGRRRGHGPPQGGELRILLSNRNSIRQAIVTKEVLEKPLALRETNLPGGL